jgi:hypothetical protein
LKYIWKCIIKDQTQNQMMCLWLSFPLILPQQIVLWTIQWIRLPYIWKIWCQFPYFHHSRLWWSKVKSIEHQNMPTFCEWVTDWLTDFSLVTCHSFHSTWIESSTNGTFILGHTLFPSVLYRLLCYILIPDSRTVVRSFGYI